ncbi:serine/threonine-protein kinase [Phycicoccus flavus]|uniref:serine/threonine-protein kinase n=1 Tax=Phycicoccus flavus TaxID=2502783 RepID=UPI000FEB930A|nr:serine/threonine-protein kinase [Phycicoccus flavus]NHA67117.1 protein kinase [Phycicoccus flavus]
MPTATAPCVPGYELGHVLGAGGSGEVWEGVREADGHRVAVKVLRADPEALDAAAREAAVTSRVAADHVLAVEATVALDDGRLALVLPLLRGGSLGRLVAARGHLTPGEVVTVLAPLAATLGRLHAAGVVHGDVSPGNVLLDLDGRPVLADLGLGRVVGEAASAVWGTDCYVAPEVLLGADPAAAADVYALGALGWHCLAGAPPGPPGLRPALAEVSRAGPAADTLVEVLESAAASRPERRPSADALAGAIFAVADPEPLRLVHGEDEVSAVTYRLRAAATAPPEPEPVRRRWRLPSWPRDGSRPGRRPTRTPPAVSSPPGPRAPGAEELRRRPPGRRAALGVAALAGVCAGGAVLAGVAGALPHPAPPTSGRPATSAESAGTSASAGRTGPGASRTGRAPGPLPARPADPRADVFAAADRPTDLLAVLAQARAEAWRTGDPRHLAGAGAEDGPLRARDEVDLGALRRRDLRYEGLTYRVSRVAVVRADEERATLRARLRTSAYTVAGPGGGPAQRRPASPPTDVVVELAWTADGWRVVDVGPP